MISIYHILFSLLLYSALAMGFNVAYGYTGLLSLAYAMFYGIGAYMTAGIAKLLAGPTDTISLPAYALCAMVATLGAGILANILGAMLGKLRGDYFIMGTFAAAEMVHNTLVTATWTGGSTGVRGIPSISDRILPGTLAMAAILCALVYYVCLRLEKSRAWITMNAVREDDTLAIVSGLSPRAIRRRAFVISSMIAGLCGSVAALYYGYIDPSYFTINEAILILAMVGVGASRSRNAAAAGAIILLGLNFAVQYVNVPETIAGGIQQLLIAIALGIVAVQQARRVRVLAV